MHSVTILERAFILARSGEYSSVHEIRLRLKSEGFSNVEAHLSGRSISRQLRGLCQESRGARLDNSVAQ